MKFARALLLGFAAFVAAPHAHAQADAFPQGCAMPPHFAKPVGAKSGWSVSTAGAAEGICSLRTEVQSCYNGYDSDSGISKLAMTETFLAGTASFAARITGDWQACLKVTVDGTPQAIGTCGANPGFSPPPFGPPDPIDTGWQPVSFPITAGVHRIEWTYTKGCYTELEHHAWIDALVLPVDPAGGSHLSFEAARYEVLEGGPEVSVAVQRVGPATAPVSVTWTTVHRNSQEAALAGQDYGTPNLALERTGTLSWAAGDSAPKFITLGGPATTIPILDDRLIESGALNTQDFDIALTNPTGGAVLGIQDVTTVAIHDDDGSVFFSSASNIDVPEAGPDVTVMLVRTGSLLTAGSVRWTAISQYYPTGVRFGTPGSSAPLTGILSFPPGVDTLPLTIGPTGMVRIIDNEIVDGIVSFDIRLSEPTGGISYVSEGSLPFNVSIIDDDTFYRLSSTSIAVGENSSSPVAFVLRVGGSTAAAGSVNYTVQDITARVGIDYGTAGDFTPLSGTLTWGPGDTSPRPISIPIIDNNLPDADRTFRLILSGATHGQISSGEGSALVRIANEEVEFSFAPDPVTVFRGSYVMGLAGLCRGNCNSFNGSTVSWRTINGTAVAGVDFGTPGDPAAVTGTAFADTYTGYVMGIQVPLINGASGPYPKSFTIELFAPQGPNATLGAITTAVVTIYDGNVITFLNASTTITEGVLESIYVNRSAPAPGPASVTWTTVNGSAIVGQDFGIPGVATARTGVLTWGAGDTEPKVISLGPSFTNIPVRDNTVPEANKSFSIVLSNPTGGATLAPPTTTNVTVVDTDNTIQFTANTAQVGGAGGPATLTITRTGALGGYSSVKWTAANGTAVAGVDYGIPGNPVLFSDTLYWEPYDATPRTIVIGFPNPDPNIPGIPIISDAAAEPVKTFTVSLSAPNGTVLGANKTVTVSILSDDFGARMAKTAVTVAEGEYAVIPVQRVGSLSGSLVAFWTASNGTAISGTHYSIYTSGTVEWPAGDGSPREIRIGTIDDGIVNAPRTFTVTLNYATAAPASTTVSIVDNESVIQFSSPTASAIESTGNLTLTVNRTGSTASPTGVVWYASDGTAKIGEDFGQLGIGGPGFFNVYLTGTLNWAAGDATPKTITIPLIDDGVVEGAKTFRVILYQLLCCGSTFGTNVETLVTLNDNDSGANLGADTYLVAESAGTAVLTVNRIGPASSVASVKWTAANGLAIAGTDYGTAGNAVPPSGMITWAAGDAAPKTLTIPILNDSIAQGTIDFTVTLSQPSATLALAAPTVATVRIFDDEGTPAVQLAFAAPKVVVREDTGTATVRVTRSGDYSIPASVKYATVPGSASQFSDFTTTTGTLTWTAYDAGTKSIVVPILNDTAPEPSKAFTVVLSAPSLGAGIVGPASATIVIEDDDEPYPPRGKIPQGWLNPSAGATAGFHVSGDPGAFDGLLQLRSDTVYDGETAGIEVTGNYQAGTVTFRYKVSSELNFDFLRFYVDGVERAKFSGTSVTGWTLFSLPVTAGLHTFRWTYGKDASGSVGADAAWIDAVTLPAPQ